MIEMEQWNKIIGINFILSFFVKNAWIIFKPILEFSRVPSIKSNINESLNISNNTYYIFPYR